MSTGRTSPIWKAYTGHFEQAIDYGERSLALNATLELPYQILARAYLGAGRPQKALEIARLAVRRGLAGEATHRELMRIAYDMHDRAAYDREKVWAVQNPPSLSILSVEGEAVWSQGRLMEGSTIFADAAKLAKAQGLSVVDIAYEARMMVELGLREKARVWLSQADDPEDPDYMFTVAEIGDPAQALDSLAKYSRQYPSDTLFNAVYAPEVRAALDLRRGDPAAAAADLQSALPFRARSPEVDDLLGAAYLAARDGRHAVEHYRMILANPGWYPESPVNVLAELGLARALVLQGDVPGARRAYQRFLTDWKDADPGAPLLKAAKAESARLS